MFVAAVQSFVGPLDEYFTPLDEAGCGKSRKRAKDYFLQKCSLHPYIRST